MKKFDFKIRLQWGWFKAALIGAAIAILVAPAADRVLEIRDEKKQEKENPILSMLDSISFGSKVKVMINGDVVALAKSEEAAKEAFKTARLAYNANGVRIVDINATYEEVDKEKDAETVKGMHLLREEKLSDAILNSFDKYADSGKELAYTMRIDDYTVSVSDMEDLISILEQAQSRYDVEDSFKVELNPPASRNVTMYEVGVTKKAKEADLTAEDIHKIAPARVRLTGENGGESGNEEDNPEDTGSEDGGEGNPEDTGSGDSGEGNPEDTGSGDSGEGNPEDAGSENNEDSQGQEEGDGIEPSEEPGDAGNTELQAQAAEDGIKYVGFNETIQVMETYVGKDQIKNQETAYNEITAENEEASIYVVQPGDSLSVIAEKNNLTMEQIKEMNPSIESDDNIRFDDRLNITVPRAAVQILVEKQETYEETYNEDVVYEDDANMYIGETEVVQEGSSGTHIVTDLVTYKDDMECDREQLTETVEVAAVAQVVRRGTKSKPTYMYPVTNWILTSNFGYRWGRLHAGVDVGVPVGTTVRASRGGQVITAGWVGGYGNCVMVDHGDGVCTLYGHLSEVSVSVGQYVDQGQQVALSGNTGRSTGPHLHFEIRVNGSAVDPLPYLY